MHILLQRLLEFARAREREVSAVDLAVIIEGLRPLLKPLLPARIRFSQSLSSEVGPVLADALNVEQILVNLLINARDSISGDGMVSLEVRPANTDELAAFAVPPVRAAAIVVRDSGSGIAAADLMRIFVPFHTSKAAGTGLGLFMVRTITRRHMGEVLVSSEPGVGTTFTVLLPAAAQEPGNAIKAG